MSRVTVIAIVVLTLGWPVGCGSEATKPVPTPMPDNGDVVVPSECTFLLCGGKGLMDCYVISGPCEFSDPYWKIQSEPIPTPTPSPTPTPTPILKTNIVMVYWVRYFDSPEDYQSYKLKVETLLDTSMEEMENSMLPVGYFGWGFLFGQVDADWADNPDMFPLCVKMGARIPEWYTSEMWRVLALGEENLLEMNNEICQMCLNEDVGVFQWMHKQGITDYER